MKTEVKWWKFWRLGSGAVGGMLAGVLLVGALFFMLSQLPVPPRDDTIPVNELQMREWHGKTVTRIEASPDGTELRIYFRNAVPLVLRSHKHPMRVVP